jgi:hypothetical protein
VHYFHWRPTFCLLRHKTVPRRISHPVHGKSIQTLQRSHSQTIDVTSNHAVDDSVLLLNQNHFEIYNVKLTVTIPSQVTSVGDLKQ